MARSGDTGIIPRVELPEDAGAVQAPEAKVEKGGRLSFADMGRERVLKAKEAAAKKSGGLWSKMKSGFGWLTQKASNAFYTGVGATEYGTKKTVEGVHKAGVATKEAAVAAGKGVAHGYEVSKDAVVGAGVATVEAAQKFGVAAKDTAVAAGEAVARGYDASKEGILKAASATKEATFAAGRGIKTGAEIGAAVVAGAGVAAFEKGMEVGGKVKEAAGRAIESARETGRSLWEKAKEAKNSLFERLSSAKDSFFAWSNAKKLEALTKLNEAHLAVLEADATSAERAAEQAKARLAAERERVARSLMAFQEKLGGVRPEAAPSQADPIAAADEEATPSFEGTKVG